jgi:hypothetical protein
MGKWEKGNNLGMYHVHDYYSIWFDSTAFLYIAR